MELYQLIAVVDREMEEKLEGVFRTAGTAVGYSQPAHGTAGRDILARYGLAQTEKRIVATIAGASQQRMIFQLARKLLYMDIPGNGILAAIPIKAVGGRQALAHQGRIGQYPDGYPAADGEAAPLCRLLYAVR